MATTTFNKAWLEAELEHRPSTYWEPHNKLSSMDRIIRQLQLATQGLKQSNDKAEAKASPILCEVGYFRVVDRGECVDAANKEAVAHGSILAFKGGVTCIMPKLIDGWTKYGSAA